MRKYALPAVLAAAVLVGGGIYFNAHNKVEPPKKNIVQEVHGIGVIDLEQIRAKHPDGERLQELRARELRLKLEWEEAMHPVTMPKPPEIKSEPFDENARQKNMQALMEKLAAVKAKKLQLTEQFKKETEADYIRRRDEVRDVYVNEALNIKLKLQNAETLQLTRGEYILLQQRLDELVMERNQKQAEMLNEWTAEINARVEAAVADDMAKIKSESGAMLEEFQADANQTRENAQNRNQELANATIQEIENRQQRRRELFEEMNAVAKERATLEGAILDSIVDEAGKLGALHRLEAVIVKRELSDEEKTFKATDSEKEFHFDSETDKKIGAIIYPGTDTKDLTEDLLKALALRKQTVETSDKPEQVEQPDRVETENKN